MRSRTAPARPLRARGFTLIELMFTVSLLALLATLALPPLASTLARHRLKAAAEHLANDLAELRFESAQRGVPLHLRFDRGEQWCYALAEASPCGCRSAGACRIKAVSGADFPGVRLVEAQDAQFRPEAAAALETEGGALLQGADGSQLRVALTRLGRPKVCAPGGTVGGYAAC
jgi:type IV fimbrial biogenesis protein FimT